eukprot:gene519-654_t
MKISIGELNVELIEQETGRSIYSKQFQVENETDYTMIISGYSNRPTISILSDNNHFPSIYRRTTIRFIHCSPNTPNVDVGILNGGTLFSGVGYIGGSELDPKMMSKYTYISIPNNPYSLYIHEPDNTSIPFNIPDFNLVSSRVTSLLLIGLNNDKKYPLQLFSIPYPPNTNNNVDNTEQQSQSTFLFQKQLTNSNLSPHPSTNASSSTFVQFSLAILSFVFLALISVI